MRPKSLKNWQWWILFFVLILGVWQICALTIHNSLVCPPLQEIFQRMVQQIRLPVFIPIVSQTFARSIGSLFLSFALALGAAFTAFLWNCAAQIFNRLVSLLQTVPNVSFIILFLFWMSRDETVFLVCFFLLFPLCYRILYEELISLQNQWGDVWAIYPQPVLVLIFKECLPQMRAAIYAALKSGVSLSFKACAMAEILTSVTIGIGKSMQMARMSLDVAGVLGWTIWLILLVYLSEWVLQKILSFFYDS